MKPLVAENEAVTTADLAGDLKQGYREDTLTEVMRYHCAQWKTIAKGGNAVMPPNSWTFG